MDGTDAGIQLCVRKPTLIEGCNVIAPCLFARDFAFIIHRRGWGRARSGSIHAGIVTCFDMRFLF